MLDENGRNLRRTPRWSQGATLRPCFRASPDTKAVGVELAADLALGCGTCAVGLWMQMVTYLYQARYDPERRFEGAHDVPWRLYDATGSPEP